MIKNNFNLLLDRWRAKLNKFWLRILRISISISIISGGYLELYTRLNLEAYGVSSATTQIAGYIVAISSTMALAAKLTKQ